MFFKETFTFTKYLGIFFLVCGAILISQKDKIDFRFNKAFWLMALAAITMAIGSIITKYLLNFGDFWTIFSYTRGFGETIALIPIIYLNFKDIKEGITKNGKKAIGAMFFSALFGVFGIILITIAVSTGSVTLVYSLSSIQPFFCLNICVDH